MWTRGLIALLALAFAALLAACGSTPADDPREILRRTVERGLTLRSVHLEAQVLGEATVLGGAPGATAEGDVDLAATEAAITARSDDAAAGEVAVVFDAATLYVRMPGDGWQEVGDPVAGAGLGGVAGGLNRGAIAEALRGFVSDERIEVLPGEDVDCPIGRCHQVGMSIPAAVAVERLSALAGFPLAGGDPIPPEIPGVELIVTSAVETYEPVRLELRFAPDPELPIHFVVDLSRHDEQVRIEPPAGAVPAG